MYMPQMTARQLLDHLEREPEAYARMLDSCSYSLPHVAHRLAVARLECWRFGKAVPSPRELHAAAREICERGCYVTHIPNRRILARMAREAGLEVLPE